MNAIEVKAKWVRGHDGSFWNERCDELANAARKDPLSQDQQPESHNISKKKNVDQKIAGAKFIPDEQGGHILFNGKIWRSV